MHLPSDSTNNRLDYSHDTFVFWRCPKFGSSFGMMHLSLSFGIKRHICEHHSPLLDQICRQDSFRLIISVNFTIIMVCSNTPWAPYALTTSHLWFARAIVTCLRSFVSVEEVVLLNAERRRQERSQLMAVRSGCHAVSCWIDCQTYLVLIESSGLLCFSCTYFLLNPLSPQTLSSTQQTE